MALTGICSNNHELLGSAECSLMQDLQRRTLSRHGEPLTLYSLQCAEFHYFTTCNKIQRRPLAGSGFEAEFCHLLDCDLEQIPQSENHIPHLYKIK